MAPMVMWIGRCFICAQYIPEVLLGILLALTAVVRPSVKAARRSVGAVEQPVEEVVLVLLVGRLRRGVLLLGLLLGLPLVVEEATQ